MGQRVLITAGASGLGRSMAEAFANAGARVFICDTDTRLLAELETARPQISAQRADVSDAVEIGALFDEVEAAFGGLDVLINNAGISGPAAAVEDVAPDDWQRTLDVNITGQFLCTRRAVPLLKAAGGGAIINISSTAGTMGYPMRTPYAASKWAVIGFTKTLAMELGEHNIRANAICPGPVDGPRMDRVIAAEAKATGESEQTVHDAYASQVSLRTFIKAEDIANTALFLCSQAGQKISGQVIGVDGHTETLR